MKSLMASTVSHGSLALLPYPIQTGAKETLEFYTDINASATNETEDRSQMRAIPRQSYAYVYDLPYLQTMGVFNAVSKALRAAWAVPEWSVAQAVTVVPGQIALPVDTLVHDFRVGSLALLYSLTGLWELVEVSALTSVSITVPATTLTGLIYVIPVRVGYVSAQTQLRPSGYDGAIKLTFNIDDVLAGLTETVPQLNGLDLYTDPYLIDGTGTTTISQEDEQVEYGTGNIAHATPWARSQYGANVRRDGLGAADLWAMKQFFYRRAGKFRPFYQPTFESNLRKASTGTVGSTFKFWDDGYVSLLSDVRTRLGFQLRDDSWLIRNASAAIDLGGGQGQVTLGAPLSIPASQIRLVSFVGQSRLDTDRLEISHQGNGYFTTAYNILEITP